MPAFQDATALVDDGGGGYRGVVAEGWDIGGNANGGYLLAIAGRALVAATGRPHPVSVTGHFLAPGRPGPLRVATTVVKEGRRFATATALVHDADRPLLQVVGTTGDLTGSTGPELVTEPPVPLPDPDGCVPVEPTTTFPPPFMGRIELRLHPDDLGFAGRPGTGEALVRGWFRLRDDEPVDALALLCAVDAFPPTVFNAALPLAWTPTVELTAHVRAVPAPGWLRCRFTTRFVTGGFLEEDGEVWDATGRLVAQSRQLALVPRG